MQLLPSLIRTRRELEKEAPAGSHLPYTRHVNDHTLETRDGLLLQVIKLRGLLFETADSEELQYRKSLRDAVLRAIGSARFAIYHHIVRREVSAGLTSEFPDSFSAQLDAIWMERLAEKRLYSNDLYLTLLRRPQPGRTGWLARLQGGSLRHGGERARLALAVELRELDSARETLMAQLADYAPRLLGVYALPGGHPCSEPIEFLSYLLNGQRRPVQLPFQDVSAYIPYRRISFGENAVELGEHGDSLRRYTGIVSIKDYPTHSMAGMFDDLLRLPFEMVVSQSFSFVNRQQALDRMKLVMRRMRSSEDEAVSLREDLAGAKDDVAAGRAAFGEHHMTVAIHADSPEAVDTGVAETLASLADLGIMAHREDVALEPAFWAQFPGNFKYIARRAYVSTRNFAGFASAHNFALGQREGNHWGEAVTLFETTAASPYYFNFHKGDLGNFTIIGPSGSGKTVVLNFMLAQACRFNPRIFLFDKDRGAELFVRALGGRYEVLRPGVASGLNPLMLTDTPANRMFLIDWIARLAEGTSGAELDLIRDAVNANFEEPPEHRRLRHLVELFRGTARPRPDDLWSRLRPWWGAGERAWLFDNGEDRLDMKVATLGFDMTALLDEPQIRTPALMYLFHRVEERLNGDPAIIVVDEGWKALDDEVFVERIRDWEKTIRKRNGIVGFATQSAQDALKSQIASAIIEQAATQIFMANPKAREVDYVDGFGLTRHEFNVIRNLPDRANAFLIKHGHDSVVARLNLSGERELLTILSGREATVRMADDLRARHGDDPAVWLPLLLERA